MLIGDDLTFHGRSILDALEGHRPIDQVPGVIRQPGGGMARLLVSGRPRYCPATGRSLGAEWLLADLTNVFPTLRRMISDIDDTSCDSREFLANVSHDLLTPLNAITGFSECIQMELFGPLGNNRYLEAAGSILIAAREMKHLSSRILLLMQARSMGLRLVDDVVDVEKLVSGIADQLKNDASVNDMPIDMVIGRRAQFAITDAHVLKTIVHEILDNAIKFRAQGRSLRITSRLDQYGAFVLVFEDQGDWVTRIDRQAVMKPFHRGVGEELRSHVGTGLGLPIVSALADCLEGVVELRSGSQGTSIVELRLPISSALV